MGASLKPRHMGHHGLQHPQQLSRLCRLALIVAMGLATVGIVLVPAREASAATWTVTNCNDSGAGSLRQAVADAGSGDTITFAFSSPCSDIQLTSVPITVATNLTIDGPGASALTLSGFYAAPPGPAPISAFVVDSGVTATISGLTIEGFGPVDDGGIENDGTLTVTDSTLSNNFTEYGGGIYNTGTLTVTDSTLSNNLSPGQGGGIYNTGTATVTDSTFSGDRADIGGGINNYGAGATLTVTDSTFSGTTAGGDGIYNNGGAATLTHVTLSGNTDGGGIDNGNAEWTSPVYGQITLVATIVANNGSGMDCESGGPITDGGYNLDDDGSCGFSGTSLSDTPAGLDPSGLQDNGGPTQTIALAPGSSAIGYVTDSADCLPTDQRGATETTPCDIGAYDSEAPPPPPAGASSSSSGASNSYPSNVATASNADTTVTGAGDGGLTLAQYPSNPAAAASFSSSGQYFDVAVSTTNEFSSLAIQNCDLNGGDALEWFNPSANSGAGAWQPVVGDPGPSYSSGPPACVSVTLDSTTSPSLSQLTGTVFGVATSLPAATPETPLTVLLPASGIAIMGAWFGLRRRRTRTV